MKYLLLCLLLPAAVWAGPLTDKLGEMKTLLATGGVSLALILFLVVHLRALYQACIRMVNRAKQLALKLQKGEMPSVDEVRALIIDVDGVTETLAKIAARFGLRKQARWLRDLIRLE